MTTPPASILEKKFSITSADVDFSRTLSPAALTNFLIQAAWQHADNLGYGVDFLHEHKLVWVLSRLEMEILSRPGWNEQISVTTWPKGIHRLFYLRDMEVTDSKGNLVARVTTQWLIIDLATKRPKLYKPDANIFHENKDRHAINKIDLTFDMPEGQAMCTDFMPRYSDIDLNQHLTTTSYVDYMLDTFSLEELGNLNISGLTLNFLKEIQYGSQVEIKRIDNAEKGSYLFLFRDARNGTSFFKGRLSL